MIQHTRAQQLNSWLSSPPPSPRLDRKSLVKSDSVMDIIFSVATYIAMFLCLFSLMSSMYTNIFEQSKEIAILRAMGLR